MRIAIDMDEVLADSNAAKLALYRDHFGYNWSDDEMAGRPLHELAAPEHADAVEAIQQEGSFFADLPVMAGAQAALEGLVARHEVFVASAAMEYPASVGHKVRWMQRHFPMVPELNIILLGHKFVLAVDALIDDSLRHFSLLEGRGLLFDAPHNAGVPWPHRLNGWSGGADAVDELLGL
ncbi:5' nucleotidase, NT5C type [Pelagovum pacificum]|uniref:Uncharacterized protein n=1 Tax=Pelagovum pacificum TaxID=2588711 RepID=A0A5C5GBB2_9RHOB|nr:hypothetical protein [Pelagovum pacificum]QQA41356.1 hypothetical protein I8N54_10995 [Pelagovum pacificum]TNY31840.1 hypothetical protein FHY64_00610 [Pelagovum pacificum]